MSNDTVVDYPGVDEDVSSDTVVDYPGVNEDVRITPVWMRM